MKNHNARAGLVKQSSAHKTRIKKLCAVMGFAAASLRQYMPDLAM